MTEATDNLTSQQRLILRIAPKRLSAVIAGGGPADDCELTFISEELTDSSVKTLENAVYDTHRLPGEFATVDVIFANPELFSAPEGTDDLHEAMAEAMLPDYESRRVVSAESFGAGSICYAVDANVFNFVARTFASARFHHSLAVNARALTRPDSPGHMPGQNLYALCEEDGKLTLAGDSVLSMPATHCAADCAYHILAALQPTDHLTLGGEPALRGEVSEMLLKVNPGLQIAPLTLPENLLRLRQRLPDATLDMIFLLAQ